MNLDDEYQNFLYWTPHSSPAIRDGWRTFDSYHYICLRQWRGAMDLIAAMGTKLYDLRKQNVLRSRNLNSVKYDTETISNLAPKMWSLFSKTIKICENLKSFKEKANKWKPDCPRWLWKVYYQHVGFIWKWKFLFNYHCYLYWEVSCFIHAGVCSILTITSLPKIIISAIHIMLLLLLLVSIF